MLFIEQLKSEHELLCYSLRMSDDRLLPHQPRLPALPARWFVRSGEVTMGVTCRPARARQV
jgi:hypothetical protein